MARTVNQTIAIAKVSCYLSGNDTAAGVLYGARLNPDLQRLIYLELRSLEWANLQSDTYMDIEAVANYVYAICGRYSLEATAIIDGDGGGSVAPVTPADAPQPIRFTVDVSSFIAIGQSVVVLPDTWKGYNLIFVRNGVTESTVNSGSTYYSYIKSTRILTIIGAANEEETMQLIPYV